jgi:predicted RND superfamily exporter protein/CRP-like cAMP-binding protein
MMKFARWMVRHPVVVIAANLFVTAILGYQALHIRVEFSTASVLPAGDPQVEYYAKVREIFGSDDVAIVGVRADDIFAASTLEKIARVTDALAKIKGVSWVASITNAPDLTEDPFGKARLLRRIPPSRSEIEAVQKKLAAAPVLGKNLLADDYRGAAINVFLENLTDAQYADLHIDRKIRDVLAAESGPEQFYFTGVAHITQALHGLMTQDLGRFTPIALALVLAVFWLSFWTVRGVVLPLVSVLMALSWTLGVMVLAGKAITIGTFILPPLLLVIGSSYAIHVMARYYEQVEAGAPSAELVVRAFERVWLPLVISAFTNIVGFGSLMVNRITAIWDLGLFAVVGLSFLTITSLTFIPAALQLMPVRLRSDRSGKISPILSLFLRRLGKRTFVFRSPILWASAAIAVVALAGARLIQVDSNWRYYFKPSSEVLQENERINQEIVAANPPFYLVLEGSERDLFKQWDVLKQIRDLRSFLLTLPGITSSVSVVDFLELFGKGFEKQFESGGIAVDEQGNVLPQETAKPKPFWEDPKNLEGPLLIVTQQPKTFYVTEDFRTAAMLVRTKSTGSREIEETLAKIRHYVGRQFPPKINVRLTGNLVLLTGTASDIVAGQIESLSLALVVIFLVMSLMFLSVKVGFLAILPNALSIAIFFGVMGWLGVFLNLGTSLIAAIALGIAVDSTVHFMARLNLELKGAADQSSALVETLRIVGIPILYATVALFFGFLTFAFASLVPIQQFGLLTAMTMATALGANLVLLPALLATTKIITVWDLLAVKLGKDPAKTIPFFAGLRPAQARIVVLMGEIKRFAPGETIVRQGEAGDEMYVITQGSVEVFAGSGQDRSLLKRYGHGEVFGEMGLVRHQERSADVVAADAVELLAVNERFLERILSRYPRVGARVFLNLTRILSDRLDDLTKELVRLRALVLRFRATRRASNRL